MTINNKIELDVSIKRCSECEYYLRCDECAYNKESIDYILAERAKNVLDDVDKESNGQTITITNYLRKKYSVR